MAKIAHIPECNYKAHNDNNSNENLNDYNLNQNIEENLTLFALLLYQTRHRQPHCFTAPVPKMNKIKNYYDIDTTYKLSNYKDNKTVGQQHDGFKWQPPDINDSTIHREKGDCHNNVEEEINKKWDQLFGNHHISRLQLEVNSDFIHICTDTIQNDTGANRAVTNNIKLLHQYETINSYPIGGVKANEVAISCTGEELLPWETKKTIL